MTQCVRWGSENGRFCGRTLPPHLKIALDSLAGSTDQRFRLLSNDFDHLLLLLLERFITRRGLQDGVVVTTIIQHIGNNDLLLAMIDCVIILIVIATTMFMVLSA